MAGRDLDISPRRPATYKGKHFAPLSEALDHHAASWVSYFFLSVAIALLMAVLWQRRSRKVADKREQRRNWDALHKICLRQELGPEEEKILIASLREIGSVVPERSVISESHFNCSSSMLSIINDKSGIHRYV